MMVNMITKSSSSRLHYLLQSHEDDIDDVDDQTKDTLQSIFYVIKNYLRFFEGDQ